MSLRLRLAFMGTADFAVPSLAALIEAGHDVAAVYTQPTRPRGRGPQAPALAGRGAGGREKHRGADAGAARRVGNRGIRGARSRCRRCRGLWADPAAGGARRAATRLRQCACVAVAALARRGADRARDPRRRRRDRRHHHADGGGARYRPDPAGRSRADRPARHRRGASRHAKPARRGLVAQGARRAIPTPRAQPETGATYAKKLRREEGAIDWRKQAAEIDRLVRALNPRLPTWFMHDGERIKLIEAVPVAGKGAPGTVLDDKPTVACGDGALRPRSACSAKAAPR